MLLIGDFDDKGSPTIKIRIRGTLGVRDYTAIIDTGFTGFVALPQVEMVRLGLATEHAAAAVMLGNGQIIYNLLASGQIIVGGQSETGPILLDETTNDILIGMQFLRTFKLGLILTHTAVVLHDKEQTLEAVAKFI